MATYMTIFILCVLIINTTYFFFCVEREVRQWGYEFSLREIMKSNASLLLIGIIILIDELIDPNGQA